MNNHYEYEGVYNAHTLYLMHLHVQAGPLYALHDIKCARLSERIPECGLGPRPNQPQHRSLLVSYWKRHTH